MSNKYSQKVIEEIGVPGLGNAWEVSIEGFSDFNSIFAQTCQFPGRGFSVDRVGYNGGVVFFPLSVEYDGTVNMSFVDNTERDLLSFWKTWQELVYDKETGQVKTDTVYKKKVIVMLLSSVDFEGTTRASLLGCIPVKVDTIEMDKSSNDMVRVSVTLQYDKWE